MSFNVVKEELLFQFSSRLEGIYFITIINAESFLSPSVYVLEFI